MSVIHNWKYWCETESTWVYKWSINQPTTCPNNNTHTITSDPLKIFKYGTISETTAEIKEEYIPTAKLFQTTQKKWSIPASTGVHILPYDTKVYPVNVLSASFVSRDEHTGDKIDVVVGHKTIVGVITADVSSSDTVINVNSTVLENSYLGEEIYLFDGVNTDNLGVIVAKDQGAGTITVNIAATQGFLAASPTYVQKSNYFVKDFEIGFPWKYEAGEDKIGASYVPAGTVIEFHYDNRTGTAKDFYAQYNYLHG